MIPKLLASWTHSLLTHIICLKYLLRCPLRPYFTDFALFVGALLFHLRFLLMDTIAFVS